MPIEGVTFAGRVGGRLPEKNAEAPITLGAIFTFDRVSIDYGFEPYQGPAVGIGGREDSTSGRRADSQHSEGNGFVDLGLIEIPCAWQRDLDAR